MNQEAGYLMNSLHPLVAQLRFARSEWLRALDGVGDEDARWRLLPMNCISWIVGHLAWQEKRYRLTLAQGQTPLPQSDAGRLWPPRLDAAVG